MYFDSTVLFMQNLKLYTRAKSELVGILNKKRKKKLIQLSISAISLNGF